MIQWAKKKIVKWAQQEKNVLVASDEVESRPNSAPVLYFRIYNAVNGQILEFSYYNQKTDQRHNTVYIVEKDEDLSTYVNKCLSIELLK